MTKYKYYLCILMSILLSSCKNNDYDIINDFASLNKIEVTNLQNEPFCFKDLYLTNLEAKKLNIDIKKDKCDDNKKLDLTKIRFNHESNSSEKSRISFALFSNDGKFVYIVIQTYEINDKNFRKKDIVYKIINGNKWKIVDTYESVTQS